MGLGEAHTAAPENLKVVRTDSTHRRRTFFYRYCKSGQHDFHFCSRSLPDACGRNTHTHTHYRYTHTQSLVSSSDRLHHFVACSSRPPAPLCRVFLKTVRTCIVMSRFLRPPALHVLCRAFLCVHAGRICVCVCADALMCGLRVCVRALYIVCVWSKELKFPLFFSYPDVRQNAFRYNTTTFV